MTIRTQQYTFLHFFYHASLRVGKSPKGYPEFLFLSYMVKFETSNTPIVSTNNTLSTLYGNTFFFKSLPSLSNGSLKIFRTFSICAFFL